MSEIRYIFEYHCLTFLIFNSDTLNFNTKYDSNNKTNDM